MKRISSLLVTLLLLLGLTACGASEQPTDSSTSSASSSSSSSSSETTLPDPDGYYYDLEGVLLYLDAYDQLPSNFITKKEARDLGWNGGSVDRYMPGGAIGGDRFGNREGQLPDGRYTECDLNTNGKNSRGAERLVFSDQGEYYYTEDHYETFTQVWVDNGAVIWE